MAADDDTTTAPAPGSVSPDLVAQLPALIQRLGLMPQPVQQDTTPVSRSGISLLGEALAGGAPVAGMSDADKETAGTRALMNFSTGLMAASRYQPGQTIFSNLAQGFQGAQRGEIGAEEMAMAKLGAQQEYAQQQGQNKLEAIKTALPFLQLQARQGLPSPFAQGSGPPNVAQGGSISAANQGDFVQKFTPIAQGISDKTGLPLNYVLGQAGLETGWGSSPAAGNNNYFGITDPATGKLMSYKTPQEGADAYVALMASDRYKNVPRTGTPAQIGDQMAVAGYNSNVPAQGKTDSYGARVGNFAAAVAKPAGGSKTAVAPPAPTTPPATPTAPPAGTIQGTPDSGGTQVGGPGAKAGPIAPPGPAVPGNVNAIIAGMKGAGADPTTLAPGAATAGPAAPTIAQAGPPTVTPPAQPTPPASPQLDLKTAPDTTLNPEQYIQKHWVPLKPEEVERYAPGPDNQLAVDRSRAVQQAQADAAAARQTYLNVQSGRVPGDLNKSLSDMNTADARADAAEKDYNTAVQGLKTEGAKNLLAADDQQRQQLRTDFKSIVTDPAQKAIELAQTAAENEKNRQAAAALKTQEGEQAINLANVNMGNQTSQKLQEAYNTDAVNSGKRIDDLELLRGLSDNAGTPTLLTNIKIGDRSLADIISTTGFGGKDLQDKVGAVQAFRAGILNTVRELRSGGAATGEPRSNQDLQFVQDMAPNEWQQPATRSAIISFLQQVNQRRIDMAGEVARLTATRGPNGQLMPAGEAVAQARQNLPDFVQKMPDGGMDNTPQGLAIRKNFFDASVPPHTFFRYPNGRIDLYNGPGGQ